MIVTLDDIILFIYIYLFCFLGAFSKDMLDTFLEKISKILIFKVLISSLAVAILLYGLSEYLLEKLSFKMLTSICYIFGIVSFEGFVKYSNITNLVYIIKSFQDFLLQKKDKK